MHEQKLLFHPQEKPWMERFWRRVPSETRRRVLAILAEMAKAALADRACSPRREVRDEL